MLLYLAHEVDTVTEQRQEIITMVTLSGSSFRVNRTLVSFQIKINCTLVKVPLTGASWHHVWVDLAAGKPVDSEMSKQIRETLLSGYDR